MRRVYPKEDRCIDCNICEVACVVEHSDTKHIIDAYHVDGLRFNREDSAEILDPVDALAVGRPKPVNRTVVETHADVRISTNCRHCAEPDCVLACKNGSLYVAEDGRVLLHQDKCVGCRYCLIACPYQVRFYVDKIRGYFGEGLTPYEEMGYKKHQQGVVENCTLCVDRVDKGLEPACVANCPTSCRHFGDLDDPDSEVSRLIRARYSFQLLPEKGTDPSVYYVS